jgi:membrane protease YdiL (CAAX protease family)
MEEIEKQTTDSDRLTDVPWTIADMALGAAVAIGVFVAIVVAIVIGTILIVGPDTLEQLSSTDMPDMMALMQSEGVLNAWLVLLLAGMLVGEAGMPLGAWLFGVRKYRCGWQSLGFRRFNIKKGLLLSATVVGAGLLISYVYELLLGGAEMQASSDMYEALTESGLGTATLAITAVLVAPFAEETFFRGFLFPGISKRWGYSWGVIVSGALFAVAHIGSGGLVPIFILGMLLAWLYKKTGSLWPCIITHFAYNSLALLFMVIY